MKIIEDQNVEKDKEIRELRKERQKQIEELKKSEAEKVQLSSQIQQMFEQERKARDNEMKQIL